MVTNIKTTDNPDRKAVLSALWIFLSLNYIYCDHLGIMEPGIINDLVAGQIGSIQINQGFLLSAAILLEIPFVMVVLSRVMHQNVGRWVNIIAAAILIVVQIGTLGIETPPSAVYLFYSAVEVAVNLLIVWLAWKWAKSEDRVLPASVSRASLPQLISRKRQ